MDFLLEDIVYELFKRLSIKNAYQLSTINRVFYNVFECHKLWNFYLESIDINVLDTIQMKCYKSTYKKFSDLNKMIKLLKLDDDIPVLYQKIK